MFPNAQFSVGDAEGSLVLSPIFFGPAAYFRRSILPLLITAAKSYIPLFWKQPQAPYIIVWLKKIVEIKETEDLVATKKGHRKNSLKSGFVGMNMRYGGTPNSNGLVARPWFLSLTPPSLFFGGIFTCFF